MVNGAEVLFGFNFSKLEASLLIEICKAALVTIGAAISILIFSALAKKREQDTSLFNEIIKARIQASHAINKDMSELIGEYDNIIADIFEGYDGKIRHFTDKDRARAKNALAKKADWLEKFPGRRVTIEDSLNKMRYELGEMAFRSSKAKLVYFEQRINYLWRYYDECISEWSDNLRKTYKKDEDIEIAIAQVVAFVGHKEIETFHSTLEEDFERVIKRKGMPRKYYEPVNIDDRAGFLRIHPIAEEVRHRVSRMM